ncbi:hypothetical protein GN956_G21852 [Arapaima gigas]
MLFERHRPAPLHVETWRRHHFGLKILRRLQTCSGSTDVKTPTTPCLLFFFIVMSVSHQRGGAGQQELWAHLHLETIRPQQISCQDIQICVQAPPSFVHCPRPPLKRANGSSPLRPP